MAQCLAKAWVELTEKAERDISKDVIQAERLGGLKRLENRLKKMTYRTDGVVEGLNGINRVAIRRWARTIERQ